MIKNPVEAMRLLLMLPATIGIIIIIARIVTNIIKNSVIFSFSLLFFSIRENNVPPLKPATDNVSKKSLLTIPMQTTSNAPIAKRISFFIPSFTSLIQYQIPQAIP